MVKSILAFKHPCIGKLQRFEYLPERNSFMSIRQSYVKGSLKDMIYGVPLMRRFVQKRSYGLSHGRPISPSGVARYGRHILEGLCYFKFFGFPYPYLHAGNVLICGQGCVLTDFENVVPGIPPATSAALAAVQDTECWEIVSFGLLLFEMATGRKPAQKLGSPVSEAPEYVRSTLKSIFPDGIVGGKSVRRPETTLEQLALGSLFGDVKSDLLDSIRKKENVFAGPIEKSVAIYFRKLRPALDAIIREKSGSEPIEKVTAVEKQKKRVIEHQKRKYHKSSGRVKEAPEPLSLSDVIKNKKPVKEDDEDKKGKESKKLKDKEGEEGKEGEEVEIKKKSDKKKKKEKKEKKEKDDKDKSDDDISSLSSDSDDDGDDFKDIVISSESENESENDDKKKKRGVDKEKEKDDEAQKFIEAYGCEEDTNDDSFDIFNEYEEPKEEEIEAKPKKVMEPKRVKI